MCTMASQGLDRCVFLVGRLVKTTCILSTVALLFGM